MSKRILKNQKVVDLIVNSPLNIPAGTYGVVSSEWFNNTRSDIHQSKKCLTGIPDVKKAESLIEKGHTYNTSVKRQLSNVSTDSESDLKFPEKLPVGTKSPLTTSQLADEITFVKRFKTNAGRMIWTQCLTEAHENHPLLPYFNWIQSLHQFQYTC
ncbi:hypothetical protein CU097_015067 [Rhizopus azygosporus]|uniref:Uncharacterized protein n=1 Tax=Rhizopus azygosporus TaxID=86630 RepID=A0A367KD65_RHIAZ|nr:hypothetical protein CU097_015067 [Rhizopus azygosporus]